MVRDRHLIGAQRALKGVRRGWTGARASGRPEVACTCAGVPPRRRTLPSRPWGKNSRLFPARSLPSRSRNNQERLDLMPPADLSLPCPL